MSEETTKKEGVNVGTMNEIFQEASEENVKEEEV